MINREVTIYDGWSEDVNLCFSTLHVLYSWRNLPLLNQSAAPSVCGYSSAEISEIWTGYIERVTIIKGPFSRRKMGKSFSILLKAAIWLFSDGPPQSGVSWVIASGMDVSDYLDFPSFCILGNFRYLSWVDDMVIRYAWQIEMWQEENGGIPKKMTHRLLHEGGKRVFATRLS